MTTQQQIDLVDFYVRRDCGYESEECTKIAIEIVTIGFPQVTPKMENIERYIEYFIMNTMYDNYGKIVFDSSNWRE